MTEEYLEQKIKTSKDGLRGFVLSWKRNDPLVIKKGNVVCLDKTKIKKTSNGLS